MKRLIKQLRGKRGSAMVEAAISLPLIILTAMLMVRMFTFYIEILTTGIEEHRAALERQDVYRGAAMRTYSSEKEIYLLSGGVLMTDVSKRLDTRAYLINEDLLVRSGMIVQ